LTKSSVQPLPSEVGSDPALSTSAELGLVNPPPTALPAEPHDAVTVCSPLAATVKGALALETSEEAVLAGPGTCEDACNTPAPICTAVSPLSFFALSPG